MTTLAIIPARGGSKGIPGKNLVPFCGKPLLAWSIEQALRSKYIKSVYVSSDNDEILKVAESYGAIGIKRPKELATDTSTSEETLLHALNYIKAGSDQKVDIVVFLQATSPVRRTEDIDNAIEKFLSEGADSLFSVAVLEDFCIWGFRDNRLKSITFNYRNRAFRQDREPLYLENGSIYIFKPEILKKCNNRLGGKIVMYSMEYWKSYEIDKIKDIEIYENAKVLLCSLIIGLIISSPLFQDTESRPAPPWKNAEINYYSEVADKVAEYTNDGDKILTFTPIFALQADRELLPGTIMELYSFFPTWETERCKKYNLINTNMLLDSLYAKEAEAVVLTEWRFFSGKCMSKILDTYRTEILRFLDENYYLAEKLSYPSKIGGGDVYIYLPGQSETAIKE